MEKVVITAAHLKAIALLAAQQQDLRYYLNGVLIEATPFETRVVATDGHKLGVARFAVAVENEVSTDMEFIIPSAAIEALKVAKRDLGMLVSIEIDGSECALRLGASDTRITFKPVDGKFPQWWRILVRDPSGEAAMFDPNTLMPFVKCGQLLKRTANALVPRIELNGMGAARVTFDGYDDFCGVVMPYVHGPKSKPADVSWTF